MKEKESRRHAGTLPRIIFCICTMHGTSVAPIRVDGEEVAPAEREMGVTVVGDDPGGATGGFWAEPGA